MTFVWLIFSVCCMRNTPKAHQQTVAQLIYQLGKLRTRIEHLATLRRPLTPATRVQLSIFIQALRDFNTPQLILQYQRELDESNEPQVRRYGRFLSTIDESGEPLSELTPLDASGDATVDSSADDLRSPSPYPMALSESPILPHTDLDDHHHPMAPTIPAHYLSFHRK